MTKDYRQSSTAAKFASRSAAWGGADGSGHCVRNSAFRRTALFATEPAGVRAVAIRGSHRTYRGGISGGAVAAVRGLGGKWAVLVSLSS